VKRSLIPLVAGLAVGCGLNFTSPVLDTAATLQVELVIADTLPVGRILLRGSLWPGYNVAGAVRTLRSTSLEVLGRTVLPYAGFEPDQPGSIGYSEEWPLDPGTPLGPVELRGPDILGIGPVPDLRATPPWPAGPVSVTVAPGSALRLDLSLAPEAGDTVYQSWRLDLLREGQYVGQLAAIGPLPPTIEVPWAMVAALGGAGQARLTVTQSVSAPRDGRRYAAGLVVTTTHFWFVTLEP
jgi:hypothetical protein